MCTLVQQHQAVDNNLCLCPDLSINAHHRFVSYLAYNNRQHLSRFQIPTVQLGSENRTSRVLNWLKRVQSPYVPPGIRCRLTSYFSRPREEGVILGLICLTSFIDRVPYFSCLAKRSPYSLMLQKWYLLSFLDTLSPLWSQYLKIPTN